MRVFYKKALLAGVAASALFLAAAQPLRAQVIEGIMAFGGLAQSLLGAGGSSNPQMTAIMQQMRMVEQIHGRLDNIERGLAFVIEQVGQFDIKLWKALDEDRDITRMETVLGKAQVLQNLIAELAKEMRQAKIAKLRERIFDRALELSAERFSLQRRSSFVVPVLITAMVTEVSAMRASGTDAGHIRTVLKEYDEKLAFVLSAEQPGSLPQLRELVEKRRDQTGATIAEAFTGKKNSQLAAGQYDWFAYTLGIADTISVSTTCFEPSVVRFDDRVSATVQRASFDDSKSDVQLARRVPCTATAPRHRDLELHKLTRTLASKQLEPGSNSFLIYSVTIDQPDVKPGTRPDVPHYYNTSAEAVEKPGREKHAALEVLITTFNDQQRAAYALAELEALASSARTLIAQWDNAEASSLVARSEATDGKARSAVNAAEQRVIDAQVKSINADIADGRKHAWQVIEQAKKEVDDAIARARREAWRSEWITGLRILSDSLRVYVVIDKALAVAQHQATAQAGQSASKQATARHEPKEPASGSTASAPPTGPLRQPNLQKAKYVERILAEVRKNPISKWQKLPGNVTHDEMRLLEAIQVLNTMQPSTADIFKEKYEVEASDVAKSVAEVYYKPSLKTKAKALWTVSAPRILTDDTLEGRFSQNMMRAEANNLLEEYFRRRFIEDLPKSADAVNQYKLSDCVSNPCLRPAP